MVENTTLLLYCFFFGLQIRDNIKINVFKSLKQMYASQYTAWKIYINRCTV